VWGGGGKEREYTYILKFSLYTGPAIRFKTFKSTFAFPKFSCV